MSERDAGCSRFVGWIAWASAIIGVFGLIDHFESSTPWRGSYVPSGFALLFAVAAICCNQFLSPTNERSMVIAGAVLTAIAALWALVVLFGFVMRALVIT